MRKIKNIVIHHSVTPRELNIETALNSFDNTHKIRLTDKYKQTNSGTKYENIAYHYVIGENGEVVNTRLDEKVGYHASNLSINNESLGICLCGNFDKQTPSIEQYKALRNLIKSLQEKYGKLNIYPHNKFANKTCPGKYFDMSLALAGDYEFLFKTGECVGKSSILSDIKGWINKTSINKELAYSILIMLERINKEK
ncbi:MAG: peptidoglycan recognition protein family protein [Candidatus Gracilibacteria bacterium]|nr:peptidoglycan recognition protein family protein [Candidatus Gracilibacteria bacterium]